MKKLFAFILVFALLLSGCGKVPEVVEPTEEPTEIENEGNEEITEEFIEEIILNFGAVKNADGTFISDKTGGFLYEQVFEDASQLETKYYFYWATEKFSEIYNGDLTQFESPHGIGYSFPAEEFEEIIGTYFGATPKKLREDGLFYCSEHGAYCSPSAGIGFGGQYDIEILSHTKNESELSIRLSVANNILCLKVLLTENGGYRFLSYLSENADVTPEKVESLCFSFGGDPKEMKIGDSYANWTFENSEVLYDPDGSVRYLTAEFSADFDMVLVGYIERNPLFDLSENVFDFTPWAGDESKIPGIYNTPFTEKSGHFMLEPVDKTNDFPPLDYNERLPCKVTVSSYTLNRGYTMTSDGANLVSFEPLLGDAKLTELQEEMILNFGALNTDYGAITANKIVSLYNKTDGFSDGAKLSDSNYFGWAMSYLNYHGGYDDKTLQKHFTHPEGLGGWAYPSEYYEPAVFEFFGVPAEELRKSEYYDEKNDIYWIDGGGGIGDTPFIVVNSVEETEETVVFHITLKHFVEKDIDMALTVKLLPDGGYNYVSYLRE